MRSVAVNTELYERFEIGPVSLNIYFHLFNPVKCSSLTTLSCLNKKNLKTMQFNELQYMIRVEKSESRSLKIRDFFLKY